METKLPLGDMFRAVEEHQKESSFHDKWHNQVRY
jgi:hypothetical protein